MSTSKKIVYALGFLFLIVIIFFRKDLPAAVDNSTGIIATVILVAIVVLEGLTYKKKKK